MTAPWWQWCALLLSVVWVIWYVTCRCGRAEDQRIEQRDDMWARGHRAPRSLR